jgi:hypothetical protein
LNPWLFPTKNPSNANPQKKKNPTAAPSNTAKKEEDKNPPAQL